MNRALLRITLYGGKWRREPTEDNVRRQCRYAFRRDFENISFYEPTDADITVEAEVTVYSARRSGEWLCDRLIEAILDHLGPEYDSMVEGEVLDG